MAGRRRRRGSRALRWLPRRGRARPTGFSSRPVGAPAAIRRFPSATLLFGRHRALHSAHRFVAGGSAPSTFIAVPPPLCCGGGIRSALCLLVRDRGLVLVGLIRFSVCNAVQPKSKTVEEYRFASSGSLRRNTRSG